MKTLRQIKVDVVICPDVVPDKNSMNPNTLYYSNKYNGSKHLCLCGCGEECWLPHGVDEWTFHAFSEGELPLKVTIMPSILQRTACRSHYVITNGIANILYEPTEEV